MSLHKKFSDSEFSQQEENQYLEELYSRQYTKKQKKAYADKLEKEYNLSRTISTTKNTKKNKLRFISVFSAIAACAMLFYLALGSNNTSLNDLVNTEMHQSIYKNREITRGDISSSEVRNQAIAAYNEGDTQLAIAAYEKLTDKTSEDYFFEGMSYMYNKEYEQALSMFSKVDSESFNFKTEMNWFSALCYLQIGEDQKATELLNGMNGWKQTEAQKILKAIKKK